MSFISETKNIVSKVGGIIKKTYGPLSPLDNDFTNFTWGNLRYPLDVGDNNIYPHTVEFQCWLPDPTGVSRENISKLPQSVGKRAESLGIPRPLSVGRDLTVNENQKYTSRSTDFTRRAIVSDLIVLYNPAASWTDTVSNDYQTKSITEAMGNAGLVIEAGSSLINSIKNGELDTSIINVVGEAIGAKVAKRLGMDPGVIKDVGLQSLGYAVNPQFEQVYGSTAMREFQFAFTMTPRNVKEAQACLDIVYRFKYHASPEYTVGGGRYVIPPSYFNIEFKYLGAQNPAMPKISTCVLKQLDVSYSGNLEQFTSFTDGKPVQIAMTMQFVELEMMHKALRDIGF
jgi:hypothetical protein